MGGRHPAPGVASVHDVVVDQRRGLEELHRAARRTRASESGRPAAGNPSRGRRRAVACPRAAGGDGVERGRDVGAQLGEGRAAWAISRVDGTPAPGGAGRRGRAGWSRGPPARPSRWRMWVHRAYGVAARLSSPPWRTTADGDDPSTSRVDPGPPGEDRPVDQLRVLPAQGRRPRRQLWEAIRRLERVRPASCRSPTAPAAAPRTAPSVSPSGCPGDLPDPDGAPHLRRGVGAELRQVVGTYAAAGVRNILALRGDPPGNSRPVGRRTPRASTTQTELVAPGPDARRLHHRCRGVPGRAPGRPDLDHDVEVLIRKARAGRRVRDHPDGLRRRQLPAPARPAGRAPRLPIMPGLMPITNPKQITRMAELMGSRCRPAVSDRLEAGQDDPAAVRPVGVADRHRAGVSDARRGRARHPLHHHEPVDGDARGLRQPLSAGVRKERSHALDEQGSSGRAGGARRRGGTARPGQTAPVAARARDAELRAEGRRAPRRPTACRPCSTRSPRWRRRPGARRAVHVAITSNAPELSRRPGTACPPTRTPTARSWSFFQDSGKFKYRVLDAGFQDAANLDDGDAWPTRRCEVEPDGRAAGRRRSARRPSPSRQATSSAGRR